MSRVSRMTPEDVANYAQQDSLALSKVTDGDLVDELSVRLSEYASLPKQELLSIINIAMCGWLY